MKVDMVSLARFVQTTQTQTILTQTTKLLELELSESELELSELELREKLIIAQLTFCFFIAFNVPTKCSCW